MVARTPWNVTLYVHCLSCVSSTLNRSCTHPSAAGAIFRCLVGSNGTEYGRLQTKEKERMLNSKYHMNVTELNTNSQVIYNTMTQCKNLNPQAETLTVIRYERTSQFNTLKTETIYAILTLKYEAQTALFKDPVRTAQ